MDEDEEVGVDGSGDAEGGDDDDDDEEPRQREPDDEAYRRAFGEPEWEPAPRPRTSVNNPNDSESSSPPANHTDDESDAAGGATRNFDDRETAQERLKSTPVVERFTRGNPGAPVSEGTSEYQSRGQHFEKVDPNNPYFPFASRVDWETARWSKIQGPGSNALNDLFKIANVSAYSQTSTDVE